MRSISELVDMGLDVSTEDQGGGVLAVAGAALAAVAGLAMLKITDESHVDHGLSADDLQWLKDKYRDRESFFIETCELPRPSEEDRRRADEEAYERDPLAFLNSRTGPEFEPRLECGLYGPIAGDAPVPEENVHYGIRGARKNASRLVYRPFRPTRQVTVIAGPAGDEPCVLYTAYGGPCAPREPGDVSIPNWEGVVESRKFWSEHALSKG